MVWYPLLSVTVTLKSLEYVYKKRICALFSLFWTEASSFQITPPPLVPHRQICSILSAHISTDRHMHVLTKQQHRRSKSSVDSFVSSGVQLSLYRTTKSSSHVFSCKHTVEKIFRAEFSKVDTNPTRLVKTSVEGH